MATRRKVAVFGSTHRDAIEVVKASLSELQAAAAAADGTKLFPNGVELILIEVKIGGFGLEFRVAGPKAGTLVLASDSENQPDED